MPYNIYIQTNPLIIYLTFTCCKMFYFNDFFLFNRWSLTRESIFFSDCAKLYHSLSERREKEANTMRD